MGREESIGRWISLIFRQEQSYISGELKRYNIGFGQVPFLMILYKEDGLNQEEITERLYVDKATTGRAIKKLAEEGYVKRKKNPNDKRAYQVFLTKKGKKMNPILRKVLRNWTSVLSSGFTKKEKEKLIGHLKKMFENAIELKSQGNDSSG
jgi:DNA-binding MarR family transcriptional regulator